MLVGALVDMGSKAICGAIGLAVHEVGHIVPAAIFGLSPKLRVNGARLTTSYNSARTPLEDVVVTAGGPVLQAAYSGLIAARSGPVAAGATSLFTFARHLVPTEGADVTYLIPMQTLHKSRWVLYFMSASAFIAVSTPRDGRELIFIGLLNFDLCLMHLVKLVRRLHGRFGGIEI